jgi:FixJ family two-component response regulator
VQELQLELFHAARLSAAGQVAAALAHELNQPLTSAVNFVNAARRDLATGDPQRLDVVRADIDEAVGQMLRAGRIVARLREFVTRGETEKRIESVVTMVEEASSLALTGAAALGVEVHFHFDPGALSAVADRIQIQLVLVNLMRNALEAMNDSRRRELTVTTVLVDRHMVEIAVADTGQGLAREMMDQLFDPFASTKRHGMGLGLSICRSIVEAHDGKIWTEENPRGGLIFHFTVPAAVRNDGDRSERLVHVVDDEADVRRSLERLLLAAGFTPVLYDNGSALLDRLSAESTGCVLLDMRMPGIDGLEVQARLKDLGVSLPVILMTGHGDVSTAVRAMKAGAFDFMEKPFDDERLLAAIERALNAAREADRDRDAADAARRVAMLSRRERQVLDGLVAGHPNKVIAGDLGISTRTVEVHRARMLERLGTRHSAEAIRLAVMATLAPPAAPNEPASRG